MNTIFEYCHASVFLDNVEILYLEDGSVYNSVLKNKTITTFFKKKTFSCIIILEKTLLNPGFLWCYCTKLLVLAKYKGIK